ncbi:hypothetical protein D5S17_02560 [Pseudonocardiaceae bacterium YIM PH 21723]|nr:hypothetical protein D5S17_02560 [Pseudonocardiaceae bacterium YIM PH 21723]
MLLKGAGAGAIGGLLAGVFGYFAAEPTIGRAIDLEAAHHAGHGEEAEVFTRGTQQFGLIVATTLAGLALGLVFALVFAYVNRAAGTDRDGSWQAVSKLAGAAFAGVFLLPFLRYPSNPPGVGEPDTIGLRTWAWVGAIVIGVLAVVVIWRLTAALAAKGVDQLYRQLAAAGIFVLGLVIAFLVLPDSNDPVDVPAGLLWDFRLGTLGTQIVLWGGLSVAFTLFVSRRKAAVTV